MDNILLNIDYDRQDYQSRLDAAAFERRVQRAEAQAGVINTLLFHLGGVLITLGRKLETQSRRHVLAPTWK